MIMTYGWHEGKFVMLVQDDASTRIIARISLKEGEALLVKRQIMDGIEGEVKVYKNHEQAE